MRDFLIRLIGSVALAVGIVFIATGVQEGAGWWSFAGGGLVAIAVAVIRMREH